MLFWHLVLASLILSCFCPQSETCYCPRETKRTPCHCLERRRLSLGLQGLQEHIRDRRLLHKYVQASSLQDTRAILDIRKYFAGVAYKMQGASRLFSDGIKFEGGHTYIDSHLPLPWWLLCITISPLPQQLQSLSHRRQHYTTTC